MTAADPVQIFAVIPAAGQSQRIGRPKQLLPLGDRTMLESVVETVLVGEIDGLCVVTSRVIDAELALSEDPRFLTAINNDPGTQMLDSVLIGLAHLRKRCQIRDHDGVLVCPGDAAGVTPGDVQACSFAYREQPDGLVVAAHHGKRGHPIVFPVALETELCQAPEGGLRALMDRCHDRVRIVECASPGVLTDIDTPEDYARLEGYETV